MLLQGSRRCVMAKSTRISHRTIFVDTTADSVLPQPKDEDYLKFRNSNLRRILYKHRRLSKTGLTKQVIATRDQLKKDITVAEGVEGVNEAFWLAYSIRTQVHREIAKYPSWVVLQSRTKDLPLFTPFEKKHLYFAFSSTQAYQAVQKQLDGLDLFPVSFADFASTKNLQIMTGKKLAFEVWPYLVQHAQSKKEDVTLHIDFGSNHRFSSQISELSNFKVDASSTLLESQIRASPTLKDEATRKLTAGFNYYVLIKENLEEHDIDLIRGQDENIVAFTTESYALWFGAHLVHTDNKKKTRVVKMDDVFGHAYSRGVGVIINAGKEYFSVFDKEAITVVVPSNDVVKFLFKKDEE